MRTLLLKLYDKGLELQIKRRANNRDLCADDALIKLTELPTSIERFEQRFLRRFGAGGICKTSCCLACVCFLDGAWPYYEH